MFAEPPKQTDFHEEFKILVAENGNFKDFDAHSLGLYPSVFNQLLRNYYYRNEAEEFLNIIGTSTTNNKQGIFFIRYHGKNSSEALGEPILNADTIAYFKPTSLEL